MPDDPRNLDDSMVKLVAYSIVSVRRGHERILSGGEGSVIITGRMTPETFTSYIIGRYLQQEVTNDKAEVIALLIAALDRHLARAGANTARDLAMALRSYLAEEGKRHPKREYRQIPEEDKKYLRVNYVVSNRWPREPRKFEEEQIEVLGEIRDEIRDCCDDGGASRGGAARAPGRTPEGGAAGSFG